MLFDEYKKIFEKVLSVTEKIKTLVEKGKSDEADALFLERAMLMEKLVIPEDIDEKKFAEIVSIKEKISETNTQILEIMQQAGEQLKKDLEKLKKQAMAYKQTPEKKETPSDKNFKNNKGGGNSIFE